MRTLQDSFAASSAPDGGRSGVRAEIIAVVVLIERVP